MRSLDTTNAPDADGLRHPNSGKRTTVPCAVLEQPRQRAGVNPIWRLRTFEKAVLADEMHCEAGPMQFLVRVPVPNSPIDRSEAKRSVKAAGATNRIWCKRTDLHALITNQSNIELANATR